MAVKGLIWFPCFPLANNLVPQKCFITCNLQVSWILPWSTIGFYGILSASSENPVLSASLFWRNVSIELFDGTYKDKSIVISSHWSLQEPFITEVNIMAIMILLAPKKNLGSPLVHSGLGSTHYNWLLRPWGTTVLFFSDRRYLELISGILDVTGLTPACKAQCGSVCTVSFLFLHGECCGVCKFPALLWGGETISYVQI